MAGKVIKIHPVILLIMACLHMVFREGVSEAQNAISKEPQEEYSKTEAQETDYMSAEENHKYNISICAIFKTEPKFLNEWIEYHKLIGVDHFYLYNNTGKRYHNISLNSYIGRGVVSLINWPVICPSDDQDQDDYVWALISQVSAYENVIKMRASRESKWLIFMELDEYLVPTMTDSLTELLDLYYDKPAITVSNVYLNAPKKSGKEKLMIENIIFVNPPPIRPNREVSKTIFKPDQWSGFTWPPYKCVFKNNQKDLKIEKDILRMNRYIDKPEKSIYPENFKNKLIIDARALSENDFLELLSSGYEIEDGEQSILRFVPNLKKKMSFNIIE